MLSTHGLPVCPQVRLRSTDSRQALDACGGALVGRGKLYAEIFVPNQEPFGVQAQPARLQRQDQGRAAGRAGPRLHPRPARLLRHPLHRPPQQRRLPDGAGDDDQALGRAPGRTSPTSRSAVARNFSHNGERRSYLSASCPVPPNFTAGFLSFARATYTFAGGKQLTPKRCAAAGPAEPALRRSRYGVYPNCEDLCLAAFSALESAIGVQPPLRGPLPRYSA